MRLLAELHGEIDMLGDSIPARRCIGRGRTPWPIVERQSGERDAVLAWLNARAAALRHQGFDVRRTKFRQRRRVWAAKIAYDEAPLIGQRS